MIVLLPVHQPGHQLLSLIGDLRDAVPARVVVVDDGSDPAAAPFLAEAEASGCTVLRHEHNRGKGAALKTGFRYVVDECGGDDVVCADADGQHSAADIARVAAHTGATGHTALGVRRFEGEVPWRSRVGNAITGTLFRAATGRGIRDTQTGLRAYPGALLPWLLGVPGERFEYEMNVLLEAARTGRPTDEVPITTTYLGDNESSHFSVFSDSTRIYLPLLRAATAVLRPGR